MGTLKSKTLISTRCSQLNRNQGASEIVSSVDVVGKTYPEPERLVVPGSREVLTNWRCWRWFSHSAVSKSCLTLAIPRTVAHQAPLFMVFFRQEYWSGLPFPSPGIFLTQGLNTHLLLWQEDSLWLSHLGVPANRKFL